MKAFFGGEQKEIFTRVLDVLAIYDDSKTYIVDQELEDVVSQLRAIVRKQKPYSDIQKLPELRQKFTTAYMKILEAESGPVLDTIDQAQARVLEILKGKEYEAAKRQRYLDQFAEIRNGAERCNNVSHLRGFADKADALKIRLLNEMDAMDAEITRKWIIEEARRQRELEREQGESGTGSEKGQGGSGSTSTKGQGGSDTDFGSSSGSAQDTFAEPKVEYKVRKTRNISMKKVVGTSSWRLENEKDVVRYVSELRKVLLAQLDEDTIVNVEF